MLLFCNVFCKVLTCFLTHILLVTNNMSQVYLTCISAVEKVILLKADTSHIRFVFVCVVRAG